MPYEIKYIKSSGGVIATYYGNLTNEDLIECTKERFSSEERTRTYKYLLSDYSDVKEHKITSDGIREMARLAVAASKLNSNIILIAVVPKDFQHAMAKLWKTYADDKATGWKTILVKNLEEAQNWIDLRW